MSEQVRKLKDDAAKLIARGRIADAVGEYIKIVRIDPTDLTSRQKLGELYVKLGRKSEAIRAYQSVAGCYASEGLLLKAIAICKIILQVDPAHTETQQVLAELTTRRRVGEAPAAVVDVPMAMSGAIAASGKKSAAHIRGASAGIVRSIDGRHAPIDLPPPAAPFASESTPTAPQPRMQVIIPPAPPSQAATAAASSTMSAEPASFASAGSLLTDLHQVAARMPLDATFDDASQPVVVGTVSARREEPGVPVLLGRLAPDAPLPPDEPMAGGPVSEEGLAIDIDTELAVDPDGDVLDLAEIDDTPRRLDVADIPPIPLFSDLSREAFVALTERMEMRVAGADEVLVTEGERGDAMFVVIQGRVKVTRPDADGHEVVLAELGDGSFFGEMALLSDAPRTATVTCTDDTMLFEISKALFDDITRQWPAVADVVQSFHRNRLLTNLMTTSPVFAPFAPHDRKDVLERFKSRDVEPFTLLITRERPGDGLYVVLTGRCEVLDLNAEGREVVVAELRDGDVFGEMSMLWNQQTTATVRTTTSATVLRLPRAGFSELIMLYPQILEALSTLSERRKQQNLELKSAGIASDFLV